MLNLTPEIEKTQNALFGEFLWVPPTPARWLPYANAAIAYREAADRAPIPGNLKLYTRFHEKKLRKE